LSRARLAGAVYQWLQVAGRFKRAGERV